MWITCEGCLNISFKYNDEAEKLLNPLKSEKFPAIMTSLMFKTSFKVSFNYSYLLKIKVILNVRLPSTCLRLISRHFERLQDHPIEAKILNILIYVFISIFYTKTKEEKKHISSGEVYINYNQLFFLPLFPSSLLDIICSGLKKTENLAKV